jgi:4-carboxymuconolactone decarboxylase
MGVELDHESYARGWERAIGTPLPETMGAFGEFSAAIAFGDVWNRERLTVRERRLIVLTVAAMTGRDQALETHLAASVRKAELDLDDLDEIAITLAAYAGMTVSTSFALLARRVLAEVEAAGGDDA